MPKRMNESDRVRGSQRIRCFITNVRYYNHLTCVYCLSPLGSDNMPQIEHIHARVNGGNAKEDDNLVVCCTTCNGRKGKTDVAEVFGQEVADRVYKHIDERVLTAADYDVAIATRRASTRAVERIEMIHDWVWYGLAPL